MTRRGPLRARVGAAAQELSRRRLQRRLALPRLLARFAEVHPRAVFVEIGSNDGEQHDHLRPFILSREWTGVMVEPVPYVFERLRRNYEHVPGVRLENAAIGTTDGTVPFYHLVDATEEERRALPDWYDGIGSFSREFVLGHAKHMPDIEERLVRLEVPSLTFASLCRRHGLDHVDLLVVDTEGHDWEIVRSLDLHAQRPTLLVYEHFHLSREDRAAAAAYLRDRGYRLMEEGFDTVCLDAAADPRLLRTFERLRPAFPGVSVHDEHQPEPEPHPDLVRLTPEDKRYLTTLYDDSVPLPPGTAEELVDDNPRLADLRARYAALDLPVLDASRWSDEAVRDFLDLRYFRGETLITWHYRELPRISALKYYVLARYVAERDELGLLERLDEDGAFGCWTFSYPGLGTFSRDLLESVNEIAFLERRLAVSRQEGFRVLDIGAGYGRLAHRFAEAYPQLGDFCCVDAVPESTFLSDVYLRFRGAAPPARVVALDRVEAELAPGAFDLAVNVHSFSECTLAAVRWWIELVARLEVPRLFIVPNEPTELLTLEADGTRRDFAPLLEEAGYRLEHREPVLDDPAVRELVRLHDHFHLFAREVP